MEKYEKSIGLKTIYLTLVRRFHIILALFIPIALGSFIVTNVIMKKTYQSSAVLTKDNVFSAAHYQTAQLTIKSEENLTKVVESLAKNGIAHSNGKQITISEINSGISFSQYKSTDTNVSLTVYFQSSESRIVQPVLEEISEQSIVSFQTVKDFGSIRITTHATKATKNSQETKYFLIAIAAGAIISFGIPFVYEITTDELYDADDVKNLGCDAIELKTGNK